jgi:hypothetical protein
VVIVLIGIGSARSPSACPSMKYTHCYKFAININQTYYNSISYCIVCIRTVYTLYYLKIISQA